MKRDGEDETRSRDPIAAAQASDPGLVRELWDLLRHNKKWWLGPMIAALLLVGALIMLGGSAAAPFIYTVF